MSSHITFYYSFAFESLFKLLYSVGMAFELPKLPYEYDALEPYFDAKTMEIHYTKHHQAYVDKLNKALEGEDELSSKAVEDLLRDVKSAPEAIRQQVINHGGGHFNHTVWWEIINPENKSSSPSGMLEEEIKKAFGSFDDFKKEFTQKATTLFGSGWTWLAADENGTNLHIHNHPNQENPLLHNHKPILGIDVWEHSYYLKYQNRRAEYVDAFWNVVNWEKVGLFLK